MSNCIITAHYPNQIDITKTPLAYGDRAVPRLVKTKTNFSYHSYSSILLHKKNLLRFLPTINWLASAGKDNAICVWNMSNARRVRRLCGHTDWVQCLELCAGGGGKLLASGSNDATLRVWNVESGECVRKMVGHRSYVSSLTIGNGERSPSETNRGCSIS